jgi:beta-ureidopropionase
MSAEFESVEKSLKDHLPEAEYAEVRRILYGNELTKLDFSADAINAAADKSFELQGYAFPSVRETFRPPRIVRVGLIQNQIVLPTTAPIAEQVRAYKLHTHAGSLFHNSAVYIQ